MKTLLVAAPETPEIWADRFRTELPDHRILIAPPEAGTPVAYVAVGKPPPGLIASLTGLELVLSLNAGIEPLLAPGVSAPSIPIVRMVDDGLTEGMVDWVLAQVLAWHRNLFAYAESQNAGLWAPRPERLARERVVTVLGAGALGRPVAGMLRAFGFRVRVWSRTLRIIEGVDAFAGAEGFAPALDGADVLINVLPLTAETEDLLDARAFDRLAPGALVINAGRGATVVDEDLFAALDLGRLSGAALDVFRQEPLPDAHPFWRHPGVRLSPHVAAPTHPFTAVAVMAETVRRWERGEALDHLVDRARGY
jgi:glyoxylate/hydroxypyruvate reductase A